MDSWVQRLSDLTQAIAPRELSGPDRHLLNGPGLYSWFVDADGASDLSRGLGEPVEGGLVYVGQTGGARWPSGDASAATLPSRLGQHARGRRSASTLRWTLGVILDAAYGRELGREELTRWIAEHLKIVPVVVEDSDSLLDLERQVVEALDPPLNLDHVGLTDVRRNLKRLRAGRSRKAVE